MKLIVIIGALLFLIDAYSLPRGQRWVGGFTGRAKVCSVAKLLAIAKKDSYCRKIRRNYTCGPFVVTDEAKRGRRCGVRGKVKITRK